MDTTKRTLQRSNNGSLAWYQTGDGVPLVFVHGVGLRAESWCAQIDYFSQSHRVYALDMPGHGGSPCFTTVSPDLGDYSQRIRHFLLTEVREPVVLIGHSMGAMLALDIATRFPDACQGVAALNAIYRRASSARLAVQSRAAQLENINEPIPASATVQRWFGAAPTAPLNELADLCHRWLLHDDRKGYADAYRVFANEDGPSTQALQQLRVPGLFLTGTLDKNSIAQMSTDMGNITARGETSILRGAGHMAQMTHPAEVNAALSELVERCQWSAAGTKGIGCAR